MAKLRWFLFLLALVTAAVLTQLWVLEDRRTVESHREAAQARMSAEVADFDGALRELGRAIDIVLRDEREDVLRTLLLERAQIFKQRGRVNLAGLEYDLALALEDCLSVLDTFPEDTEALARATEFSLATDHAEHALSLAERLRAVEPDGEALILLGHAHIALAEEALAEIERELEEELASGPAADALSSARRAASLPPESPGREVALEGLRNSIQSALFQRRARAAIERASEHYGAAAEVYVERLKQGPEAHAIAGLQGILLGAGAHDEAIDLGLLALANRRLQDRHRVLRFTLSALSDRDRQHEARALAAGERAARGPGAMRPRGFNAPELADWCAILYRLGLWEDLRTSTPALRFRNLVGEGHPELKGLGELFEVVAKVRLGDDEGLDALIALFPRDSGPEAFPGQHFAAWTVRADAARLRQRPEQERAALARAVTLVPADLQGAELRRIAGDAYLRLGRIRLENRGFAAAEWLLTHALRLLPGRRAEIEPLWKEAGRAAMVALGRPPGQVLARPEVRDIAGAFPAMGAYEAWLRAEVLLERRHHAGASTLLQRIFKTFPGMPLALDLQAWNERALGLLEHAIDAELDLSAAGFHDEESPSFLDEIPIAAFRGDQILRWIVLEPQRVPLTPLIERLEELGRHETLKDTIRRWKPADLSPAERAAAAVTLARVEAWRDARRMIRAIEPGTGVLGPLLAVAIQIELGFHRSRPERMDFFGLLERFAGEKDVHGPGLPEAIDSLIAVGALDGAGRTISLAIERGGPTPELISRSAFHALIRGDRAAAEEALDRAEPFFDDGTVEQGRLVLALAAQDPVELSRAARALLDTPLGASSRQQGVLLALAGNLSAAVRALESVASDTGDPRIAIALESVAMLLPAPDRGADQIDGPGGATDPRPWIEPETLLVYLALTESRPGCGWVLSRIDALSSEQQESPAPNLLAAACLLRMDEPEAADARLVPFAVPGPKGFLAWELRETVAATRSPEALEALRRARCRAGATPSSDARGWALARAGCEIEDGEPKRALAIVESALQHDPESGELLLQRARLLAEHGEAFEAFRAYDRLLTSAPPDRYGAAVVEALALLHDARRDDTVSEGFHWAQVEVLAAHRPRDPLLARELAELTLASRGATLRWGVDRAWDVLERFRRSTRREPIDALRRGEATRWAELLRRYDPELAEEFAKEELIADAANPELWHLWARSLTWSGRRAEALQTYHAVTSLVTDPPINKDYAVLLANDEEGLSVLRATLAAAPTRGAGVDPELVARRGLALMHGTEGERIRGMNEVRGVWMARAENGIPTTELGRVIAIALAQEGYPREAHQVLMEALQIERDPLQRGVLQTAAYLLGSRGPDGRTGEE